MSGFLGSVLRRPPPTQSLVIAVAAVCQIVTILLTSETWTSRRTPPNLPALDWVPQIDWRPPLILLAAVVIVVPRLASPLFAVVLALAMLSDQTRIQPEVVSLTVLMTLPAFGPRGVAVSRVHMATIWLWAGIHKVLSIHWTASGAAFITSLVDLPDARPVVAVLLPAIEIALGALALMRRSWRFVAWAALVLHLGMLGGLLYGDWNEAVWAWNVALGVAAFLLFRDPTPVGARADRVTGVLGAALIAYPALFYVGVVDGYLAHNLYTNSGAYAAVCRGSECNYDPFNTWAALSVPLPAEPRLYKQWFGLACAPGSRLEVTERSTVFTDPPRKTVRHCR